METPLTAKEIVFLTSYMEQSQCKRTLTELDAKILYSVLKSDGGRISNHPS